MKKGKKTAATVSTAIIAATVAFFSMTGTVVEGTYEISKIDENRTAISISVPEEIQADIYELYFEDALIDKALLPAGKIITIPVLLTEPELLNVKVYRLREMIGAGELKDDGIIKLTVKRGAIKDD